MRIFKNKHFCRWADDIELSDLKLTEAVTEITQGLFDANLGGDIYKKRIAIGHRGKRSGVRTIVAFKSNERVVFIYGFSKSKRENITKKEENALKSLAAIYFSYSEEKINKAVKIGELFEVLP